MSLKIQSPPTTLRELSLEKLRHAIITGYFPAGTRLVERTLCDEMGVSRSVVREAIRYLEAEGLVEVIPNKGPIVARLDWHIAEQIYKIRLLLECSAVADCTHKLTEDIAKKLSQIINELKIASELDDINHTINLSTQFYETLFLTAGHDIAWEVVQRLNGRISRLRAMTIKSPKRQVSGYARLVRIYQAMLEKDAQKAQQAVSDHINEVASIAKGILQTDESGSLG
ncbi:GntR family transcriptional regulator [Moraxella caviae]|uniref:GntR family transcriptional regulator n=1 Tax=Moraxella caviae TaxID=34060 RepID=A0A1T0A1G7_9GAMM|nr:GntR family transcriptional regulator [Moraxella caviae]OOR89626.1 GntR family transcriptional regulator [Moraxella caviae]STZ10314.1 Uncharacterized HTH-type transcriptional regulator ydfH [Moraxella caviae]VEW12644.1 Uncharacterized HTH-type transcriptional regulator ydfH [Moraxella caviae]